MVMLYHGVKSCSLAIKTVLRIIGIKHEVRNVDLGKGEQFSEEYKKIHPLSKVPALDIDGKVLTEGGAINLYLANAYPEAELMPSLASKEGAEALRWLFFMYGSVNPPWARAFMPGRYSENESSVKEKAAEELLKLYGVIDEQLSKTHFIAGPVPTLADYYLLTTVFWVGVLGELASFDQFKNLASFKERMLDIPKVREVFAEEHEL